MPEKIAKASQSTIPAMAMRRVLEITFGQLEAQL